MRTWDAIAAELGYVGRDDRPVEVYKWYAYINGTATGYDSESEARAVSTMVERVLVNGEELIQWRLDDAALYNRVWDAWNRELRGEIVALCPAMSDDELYDVCYREACGRSDHAGSEEVVGTLRSVAQFAVEVLAIGKKI